MNNTRNIGCSVTDRIKAVKQPRGGYINPSTFAVEELSNEINELYPNENIHGSLIGLAVDYMTRFMTGTVLEDAFQISLKGAKNINQERTATQLLSEIKGLDDISIISAVKLCGFDVCYRVGIFRYKPIAEINPDRDTIDNIRTMIERSIIFFKKYGPKILDGFTFEGGYTDIVCFGDGDFTTSDTLWDFKVSKTKPKKEHTLQLLIYWRMGLHSIYPEFTDIKYLGIYNPRKNIVYRLNVNCIPDEVIREVEEVVIGY